MAEADAAERRFARVQGARRRSAGDEPPTASSPYCLHFQRGACRYGSECAFLHEDSPPTATSPDLISCQQAYREAEARVRSLRAAAATREDIAAAALRLRELQLRLREQTGAASSRLAVPRRQRRPKNGDRAAVFRQFIVRTFGVELLRSNGGVLDVAGGQGVLAFELLNIHGIPVTVIDPRPTLRLRRLERQWGYCNRNRGAARAELRGDPVPIEKSATIPEVAKTAECDAGTTDDESNANPSARVRGLKLSEVDAVGPLHPAHWTIYWRDTLWRPVVRTIAAVQPHPEHRPEGPPGYSDDGDDNAVLAAVEEAIRTKPTQLPSARRSRKQRLTANDRDAARAATPCSDEGGSASNSADSDDSDGGDGGDGGGGMSTSPSDPRKERAAGSSAPTSDSSAAIPGLTATPIIPTSKKPSAQAVCAALRECSAIVGMHPDGPTESIVDFALETGKPFAIVPCCVFAVDFAERRNADGQPVVTHEAFVRYLRAKAPERIGVVTLPFGGRNVCVYSLPRRAPPVVPVPEMGSQIHCSMCDLEQPAVIGSPQVSSDRKSASQL